MRWPLLRRAAVAVSALLPVVALAACTDDDGKQDAKCVDTVCTGKIGDAAYAIQMPETWNGTLLLYSHGYRVDTGKGPGKPALTQDDKTGRGDDDTSDALLAKGYALAGTSDSSAGWAVAEAVKDVDELRATFVKRFGTPKRTLVWGSSMGGLVTEILAETRPWVSGSAPMCGALAGPQLFVDALLTASVAARKLLVPELTVSGWTNASSALTDVTKAGQQIVKAAAGADRAKVLYLAAVLGLPTAIGAADADAGTRARTAAQNLAQYLSLSATIRFEMERRFGGQVAELAPPRVPLEAGIASDVARLGGSDSALAASLATLRGPATDSGARAKLIASGNTTGALRVPTLTMHTVADPVALVAHETIFAARVDAAGDADRLAQVFITPPASARQGTPPYGYGHCAFSSDQMVGLIEALDSWVRSGNRPSVATLNSGLGGGVDANFSPPRWPSGVAR